MNRHSMPWIVRALSLVVLAGSASALAALPGQIVPAAGNPRWLERSGGGPFFMCGPGDPEDFLYRGALNPDGTRSGDQLALIDKLGPTGANSIYVMAVRSHGGDGAASHNPFVGHDPAAGVNRGVLDQWETWFSALDARGVAIFLFIYDDDCLVWDTGHVVGAAERAFLETLVDRFEHHKNLVWVVAEEYAERLSAARVSAIAVVIRAADDNDHAIAVHKNHGLGFSEFADDPNIDQFAIQYNKDTPGELHAGMLTAWNNAAGRYNLNMAEAAGHGSGAVARKKNWAVAMGGAYVMVIGMDIARTPVADLVDCGRLVAFMQATSFDEMTPHDDLALGETDYVLALPGKSYIAYGESVATTLSIASMAAGTYDLRWLDAASGASVTQAAMPVAAGNRSWPKPAGFGAEVALSLESVAAGGVRWLTVAIGEGSGSVTSSPAGIECGDDCAQEYAHGTLVALSAVGGPGWQFAGWQGHADCADSSVTMTGDRDCGALFEPEPPPDLIPPEIAGWPLDEGAGLTTTDVSGAGHHGTLKNGALWVAGQSGAAIRFDGVNDNVPAAGSFVPGARGSIAFWMYPLLDGARQRVMGGHDNFEVVIEPGGRLANQLFAAGSDTLQSSAPLVSGSWVHVVVTYDSATDAAQIFLDGVLDRASSQADDGVGALTFTLGTRTGAREYFSGVLDEVGVYSRVLTPGEVALLASGHGASGNAPPVADAGPDRMAETGELVALDGSASFDPDASPEVLGFSWTQLSGPAAALDDPAAPDPSFTPAAAGTYVFRLMVDDGAASDSDVVNVTAEAPPGNEAPLAHSQEVTTPQATPRALSLVWSDPDGPGPYGVSIVTAPAHGTLSGSGASRTYTPAAGYVGVDAFTWRVSDGLLVSNTASVAITVSAAGSGLDAHWMLDEGAGATAADASGKAHHGTLRNGPVWVAGQLGSGLKFDGTNDHVTASGSMAPAARGTIAFWMRPTLDGARQRILGGHDAFEIVIEADGRLANQLLAAGSDTLLSAGPLATNVWVHVACTYDAASDDLQIYLDGGLNAFSGTLGDDSAGTMTMTLGTRTGSSDYFSGTLDDVRIYNRLLSAAEIADLAD